MSSAVLRRLTIAAGLAAASTAFAAISPEAEPNELKSNATLVVGPMVMGDTLTGSSTGTAATAGAPTSRDYFRVTVASGSAQIYRNRLTITTAQAHTGAILGLPASGAPSDTTVVQSSSNKVNQWYSFGAQHDLFYRAQGAAATTDPYSVLYEQSVVTPVSLGSFQPGSMTMTTFGQGHTTDTEMFLYDSSFNLLRLNDDRPSPATDFQSAITQGLVAGTYYLALGNFNTGISNALESAATERSISGNRMDFAGSLARSSTTANVNVAFAMTDSAGTTQFPATLPAAFDMYFATFTVVPTPGAAALFGLAGLAALRRRR